jgi:hypothetical protein
MATDSINDEILDIKHQLAGRFNNDMASIVADAQSRERNAVKLPPRPWKSEPSDALQAAGQPITW